MTWVSQRSLSLGLALLATVLLTVPSAAAAARLAATEPVFGAATGSMKDEGDMVPTGNGHFTIDDRVYVGKSLGRSVGNDVATCFTGELRSVEEWALEAPRMIGTHESDVTIRSDRGMLSLRLRGQMEQFSASGSWTIVRATGACSEMDGDGQYTATYSTTGPGSDLRLTFDGVAQS